MYQNIRVSKVVKLGNSLALTIPKEMCEELRIKKGTYVGIQLKEDYLIIKKVLK